MRYDLEEYHIFYATESTINKLSIWGLLKNSSENIKIITAKKEEIIRTRFTELGRTFCASCIKALYNKYK